MLFAMGELTGFRSNAILQILQYHSEFKWNLGTSLIWRKLKIICW